MSAQSDCRAAKPPSFKFHQDLVSFSFFRECHR